MSSVSRAYAIIKENILENRYPPGHQALEQELADALGMSRTPVREALIRLSKEGLVELKPRRGMRVVALSPLDMKEIYEVLTGLETTAVELMGRREPEPQVLLPLEKATQQMESALERNDLQAWADADERFHRELLILGGNRRLIAMASILSDQAHRARMVTLRLRDKPVDSNIEHRQVLEALKSGKWAEARRLHHQHRTRTAKVLTDILMKFRLHHL